eukprot:scaffold48896_cov19-Tisochrysis_lutea.AAC.2
MDHSGWYDHKELAFRRLQDVQFVAAMGPPGGGRSAVTNRYLRHYSVVSITSFDSDNLRCGLAKFKNFAVNMFQTSPIHYTSTLLAQDAQGKQSCLPSHKPFNYCFMSVPARVLCSPILSLHLHVQLGNAVSLQSVRSSQVPLYLECSIIFNTLVDHWMSKYNYPQPISKLTRSLVAASIEMDFLRVRRADATTTDQNASSANNCRDKT